MTRHSPMSLLLASAFFATGAITACQPVVALAIGAQAFASGDSAPEASTDDYARGTKALDQQRWQDAITAFDRVVATHGKRADAAQYWKAYALNKLGRSGLVTATCNQLQGTYPRSSWNRDCSALSANNADPGIYVGHPVDKCSGCIRPGPQPNDDGIYLGSDRQPRASVDPNRIHAMQDQLHGRQSPFLKAPEAAGSDADLKMLALNSVLQRDPAQALPVIRTILQGDSSHQLKQRALSTLAMSPSPDAQSLLRDVATGKLASTEQQQAVQMLGAFQGKRAGDTLAEIYRSSPDRNIKRSALSGLFISGDAARMVDLARSEKDLQLKHDIVAQLALMHDKAATDYMLELLK